mmetsp:Transcript_3602/g.6622  ORF Transcript_3602/g.6622 Transcript_3602/m.6622 type:complete len:96 (-) Transcript_3602:747-1034(-)
MKMGVICGTVKESAIATYRTRVKGIGTKITVAQAQQGTAKDTGKMEENANPTQSPTKTMGKSGPPTKPKPKESDMDTALHNAINTNDPTLIDSRF